jgi:PD-(D/E)XK nuclease superfamily protein
LTAAARRVNKITETVIRCAIEVHRVLGAGLLESVRDSRGDSAKASGQTAFKTVEALLPVHEAQLLSYLKLSGLPVGLLINFHVPILKDGLRRIVHRF